MTRRKIFPEKMRELKALFAKVCWLLSVMYVQVFRHSSFSIWYIVFHYWSILVARTSCRCNRGSLCSYDLNSYRSLQISFCWRHRGYFTKIFFKDTKLLS